MEFYLETSWDLINCEYSALYIITVIGLDVEEIIHF
jgi:hypothetical protein